MAAHALRREGVPVTLLDKGHRPGGRMATKPFEGALFDYGAQFFTVRHEKFAAFQRGWETRGLTRIWSHGFNGSTDGHPRYIGSQGMNSIPAYLAQGLDVQTGVKVSRIMPIRGGWALATDIDETLEAQALIVTCPVPQALALFDFSLADADRTALERIDYERCLALMAIVENSVQLPAPGAKQMENGEPVSWVADNQQKGISQTGQSLTIHAGPQFSLENWDRDADSVAAKLLNGYRATAWKLHRWKYSKPTVLHEGRFFRLQTSAPIVLAGDAFGEPRVEGAALSGLAAAAELLAKL
jgi:predicted NAD/FAD-dependent oxidoreductase